MSFRLTIVNRSCESKTGSVRESDFYEGPDAGEMQFADKYVDLLSGKLCRMDGENSGVLLTIDGLSSCVFLGGAGKTNIK